jgi:mono/diheme cytochrome c family protein
VSAIGGQFATGPGAGCASSEGAARYRPAAVIAVLIVLVVALLVAGAAYMFAVRGKGDPSRYLYSQGRRASAAINVGLAVVYIGFGVVLPLLILTGDHNNASAHVGNVQLTVAEKIGREQFSAHCGVCHTLASAVTNGKVGPDLDQVKPSEALVLHTIANGCLQDPGPSDSAQACLGYGTMPPQVVTGVDATEVAKYVAAVAGK